MELDPRSFTPPATAGGPVAPRTLFRQKRLGESDSAMFCAKFGAWSAFWALGTEKRAWVSLGFGIWPEKVMHRPGALTTRYVGEVTLVFLTNLRTDSQEANAQNARVTRKASREGK